MLLESQVRQLEGQLWERVRRRARKMRKKRDLVMIEEILTRKKTLEL